MKDTEQSTAGRDRRRAKHPKVFYSKGNYPIRSLIPIGSLSTIQPAKQSDLKVVEIDIERIIPSLTSAASQKSSVVVATVNSTL